MTSPTAALKPESSPVSRYEPGSRFRNRNAPSISVVKRLSGVGPPKRDGGAWNDSALFIPDHAADAAVLSLGGRRGYECK